MFPAIAESARRKELILDGEVVAPDPATGAPSFPRLLVLGAYDETSRLVYVGHVGTGFSVAARRALRDRLAGFAAAESPFGVPTSRHRAVSTRWVEPRLVGTVE
ncbi:hypothetical protein [Nocardia sp. bgisy118]|uniref:ATP dependent DNA ligase n=1 Tax=Nocardia sp. bgisy118 TaxID=3413786 RepID=UPI003F49B821